MYVLFYYVTGYRKKVVMQNLRNSFPDKSAQELKLISKKFYHYLCDIFLETFKTLTISKKSMLEHCYLTKSSIDLMNKLAAEHKSLVLVMGHYGNWEWGGNTFSLCLQHQLYVIYHPLQNKNYDGLIASMRTRFGSRLIPMRETFKKMLDLRDELTTTAFIADQTPFPENAYWMNFLNQDTPVYKGTELISKKMKYPIVYTSIDRVKRGVYEMHIEMLCEHPEDTKEGEITELHTRRLEQDIVKKPEIWLWSHKRWKYKRLQTV